jgi:tetratricopeptide (TPR) repeat protein
LNHIEKAKEYAEMALKKDPQHELANYVRGRVYFLDKNYTSAIERFDQTIKAAPANILAYYYKALSLLAGKEAVSTSEAELFKAATGFSGDDEAWGAELAINNLEKVLELDPGMLKAKLLLAELYLNRRDERAARKQIESALAQAPDNEKVIALYTGLKVLERDWQGAIELCKKAIEKNPGRSVGYYHLGMIYHMMNRPEEALQLLEKAIEVAPGNIQPMKLMVSIYIGQKRFDEALTLCEAQKQRVNNELARMAEIEYIKGTIFLARGDKPTAVRHLKKAIADNPALLDPHFVLGNLCLQEKNLEQAMAHYKAVLSLDEKNVAAVMALGDIHYLRKENKDAEDYYRRALSIKSNYAPAANNLAFILSGNENKLEEAARFAQLAVKKMPQNANARDTMGWIFYRQGNYPKAIAEFEQSLALEPKNVLAHYHMGVTYYKRGEFEKSRALIKKALSLDPNFIGAKDAKVLLDE